MTNGYVNIVLLHFFFTDYAPSFFKCDLQDPWIICHFLIILLFFLVFISSIQWDLRTYESLHVQPFVPISSLPLPNSFHYDIQDLCFFFKLVKPLSFETYRANGYVLFYRLCSTFSNVTYWTYGYIGTLLFLLLLVFVYLFSLGHKDTWKSICTSSCSKSHQFLWPTLFTVTYRTYVSLPFVVKTSFLWDLQGLVYDANRVLLHFFTDFAPSLLNMTYRTYGYFATFLLLLFLGFFIYIISISFFG